MGLSVEEAVKRLLALAGECLEEHEECGTWISPTKFEWKAEEILRELVDSALDRME